MEVLKKLTTTQIEEHHAQPVEDEMTEVKAPLKVAITGASGNVAYSLAFMIGEGQMFGTSQPLILHLISRPKSIPAVEGLKYELEDCGYSLLEDIVVCDSLETGFSDIDIALLVGGCPRTPGMERKDLIQKNGEIFRDQGVALEKYAKSTVKVCVIGNPCNTMALVCALNAPKIPIENFTAITRLDQNRAAMQVAKKVGTNFKNVNNVIVWGNHSSTMFPDLSNAWVEDYPVTGSSESVHEIINDESWMENHFLPTVQKRGGTIIALRGNGAAASTCKAICDHMHDWIIGTPDGKVVSMAVISNHNNYGVEDGLIFSFPVT